MNTLFIGVLHFQLHISCLSPVTVPWKVDKVSNSVNQQWSSHYIGHCISHCYSCFVTCLDFTLSQLTFIFVVQFSRWEVFLNNIWIRLPIVGVFDMVFATGLNKIEADTYNGPPPDSPEQDDCFY